MLVAVPVSVKIPFAAVVVENCGSSRSLTEALAMACDVELSTTVPAIFTVWQFADAFMRITIAAVNTNF
jgi:hypothetical protein